MKTGTHTQVPMTTSPSNDRKKTAHDGWPIIIWRKKERESEAEDVGVGSRSYIAH